MTTIFTILKDVIQNKTGDLVNEADFQQSCNPYMLQRWISMESTENAHLVNETTNKLWNAIGDDREYMYKLYMSLISKKNYGKIPYIKKKEQKVNLKHEDEINRLARMNGISVREVREHIETMEAIGMESPLKDEVNS
tara:strand:- start:61 stop:474 length:414 start_codon:yes stop_codon:yes gene_type:complete